MTLCLFRVAQEALQNALKYSHARHVTVHLKGTPDGIALTISDDGAGFNVDAVWGKGLGLHQHGRTGRSGAAARFEIQSDPGNGTRLTVRVAISLRERDAEQIAVGAGAESVAARSCPQVRAESA